MKYVFLFIFAIALTGCSHDESHGFDLQALEQAVAQKQEVDLAKLTPFAWDTVYCFGPYTADSQIKAEVGSTVPFPDSDTKWFCLLVFVAQNKVVVSIEVARRTADFSGLYRVGGYPMNEAKFVVKENTLHTLRWKQP